MNRTVSFEGQKGSGAPVNNNPARTRVRLRPVALPVEHGGWSIMLEPVALGLLVAFSAPGLFLAIATLGAFLARHPFKLIAADRRRGRRFPRTGVAERFLLLYGGVALASALAAVACAGGYAFLLPLAVALPFASVQLFFDAEGNSRALLPELAGSFGLAAVASSIATAGGLPLLPSLGLWALLAARIMPSILYVRARLQRLHGEEASALPTLAAHAAAVALVCVLVKWGAAPWLAIAAFVVLLGRAVLGLCVKTEGGTAMRVGIAEIGYGVLTVACVAAGYWLS